MFQHVMPLWLDRKNFTRRAYTRLRTIKRELVAAGVSVEYHKHALVYKERDGDVKHILAGSDGFNICYVRGCEGADTVRVYLGPDKVYMYFDAIKGINLIKELYGNQQETTPSPQYPPAA
jgi:hypothetical protein